MYLYQGAERERERGRGGGGGDRGTHINLPFSNFYFDKDKQGF